MSTRFAPSIVLCVGLWALAGAVACTTDVTVQVPACKDGIKQGSEADVDCGGVCPDKCADASSCGSDKDCQSGRCVEKTCAPLLPANGPTVTGVTAGWGPVTGGTAVLVAGTGFVVPMKVRFGTAEATDVKVRSETTLTAKTPAGSAGPVDVTVGRADGWEGTLAGGFVYAAGTDPLLSFVLPASGPTTGGTRGVLTGKGLDPAARLYFGGVEAARALVVDPTRIVFTTPPNRADLVDVVVMNPGARAGILLQAFQYYLPDAAGPTLSAVQPARVPQGSGEAVTAAGERLGAGALVFLGDVPATVAQASDSAVAFSVPPEFPVGKYDVTVTTARGRSATLPQGLELVPPACDDKARNGTETDVDCGGSCPRCSFSGICSVDSDCVSSICAGGRCAAPLCTDHVKNGGETDVDCGGSCGPCATGATCTTPASCVSLVCSNGKCAAPACDDHVKNGKETDTDCGGSCGACATGATCTTAANCVSLVCANGTCAAPACDDHVKNGSEADTDCGGSCGACATGATCTTAATCASLVCSNGSCAAPACDDHVKNGSETDTDCGGSCGPCATGATCTAAANCVSLVCSTGKCTAPACDDHVKNGTETDTDCGGSCGPCANGGRCGTNAECVSLLCFSSACVAKPTLSLAAAASANEGSSVTFTVTSSNAIGADVAFAYATIDGTAVAGIDYTSASGTGTIAAGSTSTTVSITTVTRVGYQGNRSFLVAISNPVQATIGNATGTAIILETVPMIPSGLTYSPSSLTCTKDQACSLGAPTVSGAAVTSYSIVPPLPTGLSFNTSTGAMGGTPTVESTSTTYTVTATNSGGSTTATVPVAVYLALTLSPATVTLDPVASGAGNTQAFTASGGLSPYAYSVDSGGGSFSGSTYTAPGAPGSATVKVTDGLGKTSIATVTVRSWNYRCTCADGSTVISYSGPPQIQTCASPDNVTPPAANYCSKCGNQRFNASGQLTGCACQWACVAQ